MTYGRWVNLARVHMGDAIEGMSSTKPTRVVQVLAVARHRARLYRSLCLQVELLVTDVDLRAARLGRPTAVTPQQIAAMHAGLRAVTPPNGLASATAMSGDEVSLSLAAAANSLATATDILASHLSPRPRTPEGRAIRAGAGVLAALVELAHTAGDLLAVDQAALAWLDGADGPIAATAASISPHAALVSTGPVPAAVRAVAGSGPAGPPLLRGLNAAAPLSPGPAPPRTTAEVAERIRGVAAWLWRHPTRLHVAHIQLATQVGLAVAVLAGEHRVSAAAYSAWHDSAALAADLRGSPPTDDAAVAATMLGDVLQWARAAPDSNEPPRVDRVLTQLGPLLNAILDGIPSATAGGELCVKRAALWAVKGSGVRRATARWERARFTDAKTVELVAALSRAQWHHPPAKETLARAAFRQPPLRDALGSTPRPLLTGGAAPRRRPSR